MPALLETLKAAEQAKEAAAKEAFRDLVQQLAHGTEDPSLSDVQQILAAVGKSAEDLSDSVSAAKDRNELRSKVAEYEAASIEKQGLIEQIEAAGAVLEAAKRQHDETIRPLRVRISEIDGLAMEAMNARRELIERCADEELLARGHSNRIAIDRLSTSIRQQAELVRRIRVNHDHLVASEGQAAPDTIAKRERLETETKKLAEMRAELDALVVEGNAIVEEKVHA